MDCRTFLEALDQGGARFLPVAEAAAFQEHARTCPACAAALADQERMLVRLAAVQPGEDSIRRVREGVARQLPDGPGTTPTPGSTGRPAAGPAAGPAPLLWLLLVAAVLGIIGVAWHLSFPPPPRNLPDASRPGPATPAPNPAGTGDPPVLATGRFGLANGSQDPVVGDRREVPLPADQHVVLLPGMACTLRHPDGSTTTWQGAGSFQADPDGLQIRRGRLRGTFRLATRRFLKVRLPLVILGITGTTLDLFVEPGRQGVRVVEGQITWAMADGSGRGGTLTAGQQRGWGDGGEDLPPASLPADLDPLPASAAVPPGQAPVPAGTTDAAATPAVGATGPGIPESRLPAGGLPAAGTPAAGTPAAGTPAAGTPAAGSPAAGSPAAGSPAAGSPAAPLPGGVPATWQRSIDDGL